MARPSRSLATRGWANRACCMSFARHSPGADCTWLDGRCHPYGAALAYLPIIDLVKQYFRIDASDRDEDIRHKIYDGLGQLGMALEATAPYLLHLLAVETEGHLLGAPSPEAVKHQTFEALQGLVGESAAQRPLVLAIEDLHWADATSVEFLTFLLEHMAGSRVLLVCTYRPDFASLWSRKSYHSVITLPPLAPPEGHQMLTALLGTTQIQDELATLVLDKADGVPFFLEELVQVLTGNRRHRSSMRASGGSRRRPRVCRFPTPSKKCSWPVSIGCPKGPKVCSRWGRSLAVSSAESCSESLRGSQKWELTAHLAALTSAELLYARGLPPQTTYLFKHALTQEVAYRSLLTAQRRDLHHRVAADAGDPLRRPLGGVLRATGAPLL